LRKNIPPFAFNIASDQKEKDRGGKEGGVQMIVGESGLASMSLRIVTLDSTTQRRNGRKRETALAREKRKGGGFCREHRRLRAWDRKDRSQKMIRGGSLGKLRHGQEGEHRQHWGPSLNLTMSSSAPDCGNDKTRTEEEKVRTRARSKRIKRVLLLNPLESITRNVRTGLKGGKWTW